MMILSTIFYHQVINILLSALKQLYYHFSFLTHFYGVLERGRKISLGGFFYKSIATDIYRSYIYHKYGWHYNRMNKDIYSLLLIDRKKYRRWTNLNEIIQMIESEYNSVCPFYYLVSFLSIEA